jgi:hypothetical protein
LGQAASDISENQKLILAPRFVMAGFIPAIHVFLLAVGKTWMRGT